MTTKTDQISGVKQTDGARHVVDVNAYDVDIISKTTAVTIGGGSANDTYLAGIFIHTALVGTCVITGFADSDGNAQSYTLPAGFSGSAPIKGVNSAGALTITCSNASDDNVVLVMSRAM